MKSICLLAALLVAHSTAAAQSAWEIRTEKSPMTDEETVTLRVTSGEAVSGWLKRVQPSLFARCQEGEFEVFLDTKMQIHIERGDARTVRYRIDSAAVVTRSDWSESTDGEALFAADPKKLFASMLAGDKIVMEWTPFNASPVTATFSLVGLREHYDALARACPREKRLPPLPS